MSGTLSKKVRMPPAPTATEQRIQLFRQIQIQERQDDGTFRLTNSDDPESVGLELQINRWLRETSYKMMAAPSPTVNSYWLDQEMRRRYTVMMLAITYFKPVEKEFLSLVEPSPEEEAARPLGNNDRIVRIGDGDGAAGFVVGEP